MRVAQIREYLSTHGVDVQQYSGVSALRAIAKRHFAHLLLPAVVLVAKEMGHTVLFTPPYHSDLQPIELVWAHVKGAVGRQYTVGTTFAQVLQRLKQAFADLATKHSTIAGYINKSYEIGLTFTKNGVIDEDEVLDNNEEGPSAAAEDDSDTSSSSDGESSDSSEEERYWWDIFLSA